jgi:hypothetical protein
MFIKAKYHGVCKKCGSEIRVGEEIEWSRGSGARHTICPEKEMYEETSKESKMKYVIERMNDTAREWWDGENWSDVDTDAKWYEDRTVAETEAARIGGDVTGFETD